mgnify:CR=1 FL=1
MKECNKCDIYGMRFRRNYEPHQFLEGPTTSRIWIVGLNPAEEQGWEDSSRTITELATCLKDRKSLHPYFKDFKRVSDKLFELFGEEEGVAHTDLVKCSSKKWPPESCTGVKSKAIINNCKDYLIQQILQYKPRLIICNGSAVSAAIERIIVPRAKSETYYRSNVDGVPVIVVQSGFIGRIDNYSRRRLGLEIEGFLNEII